MVGKANWWNYIRSFKWQRGFGNEYAPYDSGQEFEVLKESLRWPAGWDIDGWWKGLMKLLTGQAPRYLKDRTSDCD